MGQGGGVRVGLEAQPQVSAQLARVGQFAKDQVPVAPALGEMDAQGVADGAPQVLAGPRLLHVAVGAGLVLGGDRQRQLGVPGEEDRVEVRGGMRRRRTAGRRACHRRRRPLERHEQLHAGQVRHLLVHHRDGDGPLLLRPARQEAQHLARIVERLDAADLPEGGGQFGLQRLEHRAVVIDEQKQGLLHAFGPPRVAAS